MTDTASAGLLAEGTSYFKRWTGSAYAAGFEKLEGTTEIGVEVSVDEKLQESREKGRTGTIPENGTVRLLKPTKLSITLNRWNKQSAAMSLMGIDTALSVGSSSQTAQPVTLPGSGLYVPSGVRNVNAGSVTVTRTSGTGTGYTSSAAGFAQGETTIALISGTGTILAGDKVSFAGNSTVYTVATGVTGPGNLVLAAPGLAAALPASATALTIVEQTYIEGVDYDFVYTTGDIAKLQGGVIADGATVKVTAQQNAIAGWSVDIARVPQIKGYYKFDGRNLADDRNLVLYAPMLVLASNTALDLMKNDFNEFKMKGMPELKVGEASALWLEYF